jgi:hypothetical protein
MLRSSPGTDVRRWVHAWHDGPAQPQPVAFLARPKRWDGRLDVADVAVGQVAILARRERRALVGRGHGPVDDADVAILARRERRALAPAAWVRMPRTMSLRSSPGVNAGRWTW